MKFLSTYTEIFINNRTQLFYFKIRSVKQNTDYHLQPSDADTLLTDQQNSFQVALCPNAVALDFPFS